MREEKEITKRSAIEILREGRNIVSLEYAIKIAKAMDLPTNKIPAKNYTNDNTRGIIKIEGTGVAISELGIAILKNKKIEPCTDSPMIGVGSHHDFIAKENVEKIEKIFKTKEEVKE